jgi:N-methylhydantoinase A
MKPSSKSQYRVAADIGGTFTDVAVFDAKRSQLILGKTLTTPKRLVQGILTGLGKTEISLNDAHLFLHGSTVAINTMLERSGAKTALLTTQGFRDIYEIGRINRPDSFNLRHQKHEPLVPRNLRFEVNERLLAQGEILRPLNTQDLDEMIQALKDEHIEALAILFLHAYRNPVHEKLARDYIRQHLPKLFISISSDISNEYREFERTSTVAANAYIGPRVNRYLGEIESELKQVSFNGKFLVVQSTGGLYSLPEARQDCVRMMESGPAAGVIGTEALCKTLGIENAIAFDMGGTTAKAGVIRSQEALVANSVIIGGYLKGLPLLTPMIDIHEVGTGGGSIAYLSASGALRVGPQSAGASPGPVCYGLGGDNPTVTDANLILGRLDPHHFLGGEMVLDKKAAINAMKLKIADPLGLTVNQAALGILRIASAAMSHAVKGVTTDRGLDPSAFPNLFAYGGAGPLHAMMVAKELRLPKVIIPRAPGHFSAFGMLLADFRKDVVLSKFTSLANTSMKELNGWFKDIEAVSLQSLSSIELATRKIHFKRYLDMRYVGQEHAVTVEIPGKIFKGASLDSLKSVFDAVHLERYGRGSPHEPCEIVSLRSAVLGELKKPALEKIANGKKVPPKAALMGTRSVFFEGNNSHQTQLYQRDALLANNKIEGPALIVEHASTTVVYPNDVLVVDDHGNLHIQISL